MQLLDVACMELRLFYVSKLEIKVVSHLEYPMNAYSTFPAPIKSRRELSPTNIGRPTSTITSRELMSSDFQSGSTRETLPAGLIAALPALLTIVAKPTQVYGSSAGIDTCWYFRQPDVTD